MQSCSLDWPPPEDERMGNTAARIGGPNLVSALEIIVNLRLKFCLCLTLSRSFFFLVVLILQSHF